MSEGCRMTVKEKNTILLLKISMRLEMRSPRVLIEYSYCDYVHWILLLYQMNHSSRIGLR